MWCEMEAPDLAQVIRPLLPKKRPKDARDEPGALRSFPDAEKLLAEDARFLRTPARDRWVSSCISFSRDTGTTCW